MDLMAAISRAGNCDVLAVDCGDWVRPKPAYPGKPFQPCFPGFCTNPSR